MSLTERGGYVRTLTELGEYVVAGAVTETGLRVVTTSHRQITEVIAETAGAASSVNRRLTEEIAEVAGTQTANRQLTEILLEVAGPTTSSTRQLSEAILEVSGPNPAGPPPTTNRKITEIMLEVAAGRLDFWFMAPFGYRLPPKPRLDMLGVPRSASYRAFFKMRYGDALLIGGVTYLGGRWYGPLTDGEISAITAAGFGARLLPLNPGVPPPSTFPGDP